MCQEYKMRRQVLIKRVHVTLQSFSWSDKMKVETFNSFLFNEAVTLSKDHMKIKMLQIKKRQL